MNKTIEFFYEISSIPRESGNEDAICNYLCHFAKKRNLKYIKDKYNNVIIKYQKNKTQPIILQAHMDMVCEKELDKNFDFKKDSIEIYEENGYLKAKGTTLGADNGIGVAQILNILDSNIEANIEAVFTVAEETTMIGAEKIDIQELKGNKLICLDGFSENTIICGSASFFDIVLKLNNKFETKKYNSYKVKLTGLEGGHSGFDIDKNKGNAIKELSNILKKIKNIKLSNFIGGTKFNVIPSNAEAIFYSKESIENIKIIIDKYLNTIKKKYPNIKITIEKYKEQNIFLSNKESINFLNILSNFKHGVYFKNDKNEVTTSMNLGVVDLKKQIIKIGMRSSKKNEENITINYIKEFANNNQLDFKLLGSQPGFETREDTELIKIMKSSFNKINDKETLKLETVHITVETGFFKEKLPNLEVAIISPKILGAHTINECVEIESVKKCDSWLKTIIEELNKKEQKKIIYNKYLNILNYNSIPNFIKKYLQVPSLTRLKNIGYFCGMDYASKEIYDFSEKISRYDHSLTTALITWNLTKNKISTLSALFHDISTPCFSHVIDYMNKDYNLQESTETYTKDILLKDKELIKYLKEDKIEIEDIINFKKYTIVDNKRPKLCADRLDGIILTSLYWTKELKISSVKEIINDLEIYINENKELEIGFKNYFIANKVYELNKSIDVYCHSKEDNYMMELLANITNIAIKNKIITYEDLYLLDEEILINILKTCNNNKIKKLLKIFENITSKEIPDILLPDVKIRKLNPLVNKKRLENI